MLQSLITLMLGRNAFTFFGNVGGSLVLCLLFLPTLLMSRCTLTLTPTPTPAVTVTLTPTPP